LGNTIEINLPYLRDRLRIEFFGDTLEGLSWIDKHNNHIVKQLDNTVIFPAKHFVMTPTARDKAILSIQKELNAQLPRMDNPIYRERLKMRVSHDLEMLQESGYCSGIENYSAHFDGRITGQPPFCLFDFFGDDFLTIIDESHIAIPQLRGMYDGDRARKKTLVDFGFRLPSAYDNRPLKFDEIERYFRDVIYVSATPGEYELKISNTAVEQIIRPTGLVDPQIIVKPREGQLDALIAEIHATKKQGFSTLITVLTKKLAEELARYLEKHQLNVCYLHSEIKTPQRTELLQKLRAGIFDCLVGVNLLREGLDLPEVALVAIMDGDVESFLRDKRSLIQTIGRAARNTQSKVLIFADTITQSMRAAIDETERRRALQQAYNQQHGIVPVTVKREVNKSIVNIQEAIAKASARKRVKEKVLTPAEKTAKITALRKAMHKAVEDLDFERAITIRNELQRLENLPDKK
jgi:excinuclease ABC subunit B